MLNTVTIDMESTIKEITAGLDRLARMQAEIKQCPHRWTDVMVGRYCVMCQAVVESGQE